MRVAVWIAAIERLGVILQLHDVAHAGVNECTHRLLKQRGCRAGSFGSTHQCWRTAYQCSEFAVVWCILQPWSPRGKHRPIALLHHGWNDTLIVDQVLRELRNSVPPSGVMSPGNGVIGRFSVEYAQQGERSARIKRHRWNFDGCKRLFWFS